ncbi:MAG: L,D-transpeptidase [Chloroflexi bacterium]|nr:L,D-transpeptidase [Chloroflexota bacterium]
MPYTAVRLEPSGAPYRIEDPEDETNIISVVGFYGSVHRVVAAEPDGAGFMWYKLFNDKPDETPFYYILARHMRMIPPSAFEPINPGADKMMEVNLTEQTITCYESGVPVFSTLTSSGGDGFATPLGEHAVVYKQPSRYMFSDPEQEAFSDPNFFDLPGVPFNIFFTTLGHAIHGTYWHGDYGRPRSHGCLNVLPETARWLYRWVEPVAPYDMDAAGSSADPGTPIIVV